MKVLRRNAKCTVFVQSQGGGKREVGWCLMEQSIMAGVGNIYRAEILYKSGVHPDQPANTVSRAKFELIWKHSVLLLQRGFKTGSILTVDPADAQRLGEPWTRRYIYGQTKCGECGTKTSVYGECRTDAATLRRPDAKRAAVQRQRGRTGLTQRPADMATRKVYCCPTCQPVLPW